MVKYITIQIRRENLRSITKMNVASKNVSSLKRSLLMKRSKFFYLLPALALVACSTDSVEELEGPATSITPEENLEGEVLTEAANFANPGTVSEVYFGGMLVPVEEFNGEFVYQGDIMLSKDMVSSEPQKLVYERGETPPANKSVARTS